MLLNIYNALILPHLNYGVILWGNDQSRVAILQRKAMRAISNSSYNAHTDVLFKNLKILKFQNLYDIQCMNFCYKLENKLLPKFFLDENMFVKRDAVHDHFNRGENIFFVPRIRREFTKQGVRYKICLFFNSMDDSYKEKIYTHSFQFLKDFYKKKVIDSYETE